MLLDAVGAVLLPSVPGDGDGNEQAHDDDAGGPHGQTLAPVGPERTMWPMRAGRWSSVRFTGLSTVADPPPLGDPQQAPHL